ncbi:MAG TPA: CRISPR-associated endonuclease Cas2 [Piscirickettsiaceae bacterium]|nr:CRISPR-associated endonuclease Cas2 [Piscirickettsiaceae bacterium]HIQ39963.1 CRISPR-associated endonuclease Cas2 [Sulfurivirga caldicuralii]
MTKKTSWYLIAYDISNTKRLTKIHKFLKKKGAMPLQKSVFAWVGREEGLNRLIKRLEKIIAADEDDVRIYPIASLQAIDLWGKAKDSPLLSEGPPRTPWQRLKRWIAIKRKTPTHGY